MSVAAAVAKLLEADPSMVDILQSGFGNVSAVAEALQRPLSEALGRKVSSAATGMAVRRYMNAQSAGIVKRTRFPKHIEISTRSAIFEVAIARDEKGSALADKIRNSRTLQGGFLSVIEGSYEIVILTSSGNKARIRSILGRHKTNSELDDLACVTVNWPPITKDIPGIYSRVTRALALKAISIQSFHTIGAEMMIIVRGNVLAAAHDTLVRLLNNELRL